MHMKKKILVTAIAAAGAGFGTSAVFAQDITAGAVDGVNVPRIGLGSSSTIIEDQRLTVAKQNALLIDRGDVVALRLNAGFSFNSAPKATTTGASETSGMLLTDEFGDGSLTGNVTLFDLDGDGTMERAEVQVDRLPDTGDVLDWSGLDVSYAGTNAKGQNATINMLVTDKLNGTNFADADGRIGIHTAAINGDLVQVSATGNTLPLAASNVTVNFASGTSDFILTVPAASKRSSTAKDNTVSLSLSSGLEAGAASTVSVTALTDSPLGFGSTVVSTSTVSGKAAITIDGLNSAGPHPATQFLIEIDGFVTNNKDSAGVAIAAGAQTLSLSSTSEILPSGGSDTAATLSLTGSSVLQCVTSTLGGCPALALGKFGFASGVEVVRAADTAKQLQDFIIFENFAGDLAPGTITLTPGAGTKFVTAGTAASALGGSIRVPPIASPFWGFFGTNVLNLDGTITVTVASNTNMFPTKADGLIVQGITATATKTAGATLSYTVGDADRIATKGESTGIPDAGFFNPVPAATVVARGGVTLGESASKLPLVGVKSKGNVSAFRALEGTYGSINNDTQTQSSDSFIRLSPGAGAGKLNSSSVGSIADPGATSKLFGAGSKAVANTSISFNSFTLTSAQTAPDTPSNPADGSRVFNLDTESATGALLEFTVDFDVAATAVIGDTVSVDVGGDAGVSGTVAIATVANTTISKSVGVIPDLTSDVDRQTTAQLQITGAFPGAVKVGATDTFRIIAPTGITYDTTNVSGNFDIVGADAGNATITSTFTANDTLTVLDLTSATTAFKATPDIFVSDFIAEGQFASFNIVDGDEQGKNPIGLTPAMVDLAYIGNVPNPTAGAATADVTVGFSATRTITDGLTPYKAAASDTDVTVDVTGDQLVMTGAKTGTAVVTVTDALGQTDTVTVTVAAGTAIPPLDTVDSDGNATTAEVSGGVSTDEGATFTDTAAVGDTIKIVGTVVPEAAHVGEAGGLLVAIEAGGTIFLIDDAGQLVEFTGSNVVFYAEKDLAASESIDITGPSGVELSAGEVGTYNIFFGYQLIDGTVIYYNSEPITLTVTE